jgi:hypothetical protein
MTKRMLRARGANEVDDPGVDGRLAAGKLDNLGAAFATHIVIEHLLDFFERETESRRSIRETQRAIHVAGTADIDDA